MATVVVGDVFFEEDEVIFAEREEGDNSVQVTLYIANGLEKSVLGQEAELVWKHFNNFADHILREQRYGLE